MMVKVDNIELSLKDGCNYCLSKRKELLKILDDYNNCRLPRDVKLTLVLNSDWLGELKWHFEKVTVTERKME